LDNNKNNINDRYNYNVKREEEARKDLLKKLNLRMNNFNNNNFNKGNMLENNNDENKKENKYTWDMLSNMKSSSLADEDELNNLIN
jgi:hypothetical protein